MSEMSGLIGGLATVCNAVGARRMPRGAESVAHPVPPVVSLLSPHSLTHLSGLLPFEFPRDFQQFPALCAPLHTSPL